VYFELSICSFFIDVCTTAVLLFVCWILVGRLLLIRDGSWCLAPFVCLATVILRWTGSKGCPSGWVLKFGGPIAFDSKSGVSSLAQVLFWAFMVFFRWTRGCEVVEAV